VKEELKLMSKKMFKLEQKYSDNQQTTRAFALHADNAACIDKDCDEI
jgi:hypothetical protein